MSSTATLALRSIAYIQFTPNLITETGEVTSDATAEFLQNYMREFHAFIARVKAAMAVRS